MKVLLILLSALFLAGASYCFGLRRGRSQGRRDGYVQGHERALEMSSRAIEDGVFRLAERVANGRHSRTLHKFLAAFANGEHLR